MEIIEKITGLIILSMVNQMEDCIDCLKILYPQFDYLFLFDHSNGHDRMKPDGLNARNVSVFFGGKQPKMRDSKLTNNIIFGPYNPPGLLHHGDVQSMVFDDPSQGPFYLSEVERQERMLDKNTGIFKECNKTRPQLLDLLKKNDLDYKGNTKKLRERCQQAGLATKFTEEKIDEGWLNKPKGSLQLLYERGWIDPHNHKKYTARGKRDEYGNLMVDTSLNYLMQQQHDFVCELTLLQYHAEKLGIILDRSPKCHPEVAGEGIEYVWALAKMNYRSLSINVKKSKDFFRDSVRKSFSRDTISVHSVRKSSKRARRYMLAYSALASAKEDNSNGNDEKVNVSYKLIEKAVKTYKVHRSALDFDSKFVLSMKKDTGWLDADKSLLKKVVENMSKISACN